MSLVKLIPSDEGIDKLNDYLISCRLPTKEDFHSTVYYSEENPLFKTDDLERNVRELLPITLDASTYYTKIFGEGVLVLGYKDPLVDQLNRMLVEEADIQKTHDYSGIHNLNKEGILRKHSNRTQKNQYSVFNSHIALKKGIYIFNANALPDFPICFNDIDWDEER